VAELIQVTDPDDPRLADYRDLRDVQLRTHLEVEHGLFLAEGEKVVRRALEAGYAARSFLMAERWLDGLADVLGDRDAPCYVVTEALAEKVTGFHVHRGALASLTRRPLPDLDDVLTGARHVLVLEDVVDHTNVGAIFRSGAAFGFDAVLLAPRCADPLYRRSIKVGMGAVFTTPWTRLPDWYDALPDLPRAGSARSHSRSPRTPNRSSGPSRPSTVSHWSSGRRGTASHHDGRAPPTAVRSSRCARASTLSTSRPRRPSRATSSRVVRTLCDRAVTGTVIGAVMGAVIGISWGGVRIRRRLCKRVRCPDAAPALGRDSPCQTRLSRTVRRIVAAT
jgi:tRNA G18 (ribose-2'-O)-methylase SpoU